MEHAYQQQSEESQQDPWLLIKETWKVHQVSETAQDHGLSVDRQNITVPSGIPTQNTIHPASVTWSINEDGRPFKQGEWKRGWSLCTRLLTNWLAVDNQLYLITMSPFATFPPIPTMIVTHFNPIPSLCGTVYLPALRRPLALTGSRLGWLLMPPPCSSSHS